MSDCLVEMDKFIEDGTKFDFIFGDLTDVPLSLTPQKQNKEWQFLQSALEKSLGLLKPNGKFLTHVIKPINPFLSFWVKRLNYSTGSWSSIGPIAWFARIVLPQPESRSEVHSLSNVHSIVHGKLGLLPSGKEQRGVKFGINCFLTESQRHLIIVICNPLEEEEKEEEK